MRKLQQLAFTILILTALSSIAFADNYDEVKKIVIFGRTSLQADGAFTRKFSPKSAKPRFFGKRTYALAGLQRKPTQQADVEFF